MIVSFRATGLSEQYQRRIATVPARACPTAIRPRHATVINSSRDDSWLMRLQVRRASTMPSENVGVEGSISYPIRWRIELGIERIRTARPVRSRGRSRFTGGRGASDVPRNLPL